MPCMLFRNTAHEVHYIPSTCCLCCCSSEHLGGTLGGLDLCEDHLCRLQCIASGEGTWYWRMTKTKSRAQWAYGGTELRLRHFLLPEKKRRWSPTWWWWSPTHLKWVIKAWKQQSEWWGCTYLGWIMQQWFQLTSLKSFFKIFELTCRTFLKLTARGNHWKLMLGRRNFLLGPGRHIFKYELLVSGCVIQQIVMCSNSEWVCFVVLFWYCFFSVESAKISMTFRGQIWCHEVILLGQMLMLDNVPGSYIAWWNHSYLVMDQRLQVVLQLKQFHRLHLSNKNRACFFDRYPPQDIPEVDLSRFHQQLVRKMQSIFWPFYTLWQIL